MHSSSVHYSLCISLCVDCCLGSLCTVLVCCAGAVLTWGDSPTSAGLAGVRQHLPRPGEACCSHTAVLAAFVSVFR
jgi:hypothetical protein